MRLFDEEFFGKFFLVEFEKFRSLEFYTLSYFECFSSFSIMKIPHCRENNRVELLKIVSSSSLVVK